MAVKSNFAAGDVLQASDVNTYLTNGGLVYVTSKTFTTTSNAQQFDNCFTSTFDEYLITFAGIGSTANADWIRARLVDGTTPITTGIYVYSYAYSGSAALASGYQGGQTSWLVGLIGANAANMSWRISNPQTATKTTGISQYMSSATNDYFNGSNSQMVDNSTQYEGVLLYPGSGTWSGTITIMGYRKA